MTIIASIDRGAVLFVGMCVGAVLLVAFQTDGKPLAPLLSNRTPKAQLPTSPMDTANGLGARACDEEFPFSRRVLTGLRKNRPLRIGVLGDSFGEGVWAATNQYFHGNQDFAVYRLSKEGTGFTRYQSIDLFKDLKSRLEERPIDIALVDFGANDTQGIWLNGKGLDYMSAAWKSAVDARVTTFVDYLHNKGVAVGWVGLPRMRKAAFDSDIQAMNGYYAGLMCKLHVPFVNPVKVSEDSEHNFAKELIDPETHKTYLARADDGIHMTFHGYEVIARPLLERISVLASHEEDDVAADRTGGEK